MKKTITLLLAVLLLAACSSRTTSQADPSRPAPPASSSTGGEALPPGASTPLVDTSQWQVYTVDINGYTVSLRLPDGVYLDENAGMMSTPETAPYGFLVDPTYQEIKVGQVVPSDSTIKIDENTYEVEILDSMVTFTYSEKPEINTFSRYGSYIVFIKSSFLDFISFYDESTQISIDFWIDWKVFEDGRPLFYSVVSTVTID